MKKYSIRYPKKISARGYAGGVPGTSAWRREGTGKRQDSGEGRWGLQCRLRTGPGGHSEAALTPESCPELRERGAPRRGAPGTG